MVRVRENMTGWIMSEHGVPDSRLTVLKQTDDFIDVKGKHKAQWLCECSCQDHNIISAIGANIKNGNVKSCGCLRKDKASKLNIGHNHFDVESCDYGIGWTSNTNKEFYFDLSDYDIIKGYCWYECINKDRYHSLMAWDKGNNQQVKMHWILVGKNYDHKDRNPLNNRRDNLRPATNSENARNHNKQKNNTSGFIGVHWDKDANKWKAEIRVNKKKINLGRFIKKEDAVITRLHAELKYFGEFAPQKHLFEQYGIGSEDNHEERVS